MNEKIYYINEIKNNKCNNKFLMSESKNNEKLNISNDENDSLSTNSGKSKDTSFSYNNMSFIDSLLDNDEKSINYNQINHYQNFSSIQNNPYLNNCNINFNNITQIQQLKQMNFYYQYLFVNSRIRELQMHQLLMNALNNNETNNFNKRNNNKISKKIIKKNDKNKVKKNCGKNPPKPENEIHIQKILSGEEKRTFVRISPIPNKYSPYDIIILIDKYLKTKKGERIYNSIYVPLTKVIGKNKGYCFINLVAPKYVIQFYEIFNGLYFNIKNCKKSCTVVFSDKQEIDCSNDDALKRPLIFNDCVNN